jgi:hypothetical protein
MEKRSRALGSVVVPCDREFVIVIGVVHTPGVRTAAYPANLDRGEVPETLDLV